MEEDSKLGKRELTGLGAPYPEAAATGFSGGLKKGKSKVDWLGDPFPLETILWSFGAPYPAETGSGGAFAEALIPFGLLTGGSYPDETGVDGVAAEAPIPFGMLDGAPYPEETGSAEAPIPFGLLTRAPKATGIDGDPLGDELGAPYPSEAVEGFHLSGAPNPEEAGEGLNSSVAPNSFGDGIGAPYSDKAGDDF